MNIYRVAFIGHREIADFSYVENELYKVITRLVESKEYVEFYMGKNGEFDVLAASINGTNGAVNAASYATMINASKVSLDVTANAEGITAKAEGNSNANAAATPDTNAGSETAEGK